MFEHYDVNEYIDLMGRRSSTSVYHKGSERTVIYFNELSTPSNQEAWSDTIRTLISYDENNGECKTRTMSDWTFSSLEGIMGGFFKNSKGEDDSSGIIRDVVIGPCGLYLAAAEKPETFFYSRSYFSELRLNYLDVYESIIDDKQTNTDDDDGSCDDDNCRHKLKIRVHTIDRTDARDKSNRETLSDVLSSGSPIDIAIITVSRSRAEAGIATASTTVAPNDESEEDLLLQVEFQILSEFVPSSLIGQSFSDFGYYDFYANPFMRPVGFGCYDEETVVGSSKTFTIPTMQMSAEYYTTDGSKGVSYVAFDGHNHVLRLDRHGRKSVYDLFNRNSYHTNQYSAQGDPGESLILEGVPGCCVLPIEDRMLQSSTAFELLIGLAANDAAHYLGSRIIDSISYEVYESEIIYKGSKALNRGYNMPILLETTGFSMPTEETSDRYFVTFYMQAGAARFNKRLKDPILNDLNRANELSEVLFPNYIELWEFKTTTKARRLINRLHVSDFSWALDVQPSNDPESTDLSAIFNIEQCLKDRSTQADLSFYIRQWSDGKLRSEEEITALQTNTQLIKEVVHENLAQLFGISRLNIAHLDAVVRKSTDILVDARISELVTCVEYIKSLGKIPIENELVVKNLLHIYHNRHSENECKLDSISEREQNWLAYCPDLSVCITLRPSDDLMKAIVDQAKESINRQTGDKPTENNAGDFCNVMIYAFSQYSTRKDSVYSRVEENLHKLSSGKFIFEFPLKNQSTNEWYWPRYSGFGHSHQLHRLNSAGEAMGSAKVAQLLKGLRYTTQEDWPDTINSNAKFVFSSTESTKKDFNVFEHCRIACQMDSFCGSFSYCARPVSERSQNDCVLSSTRLTRERINNIASLSSLAGESNHNFKVTITSETDSQTMMIKRDDACNLHPKDYLSDYKLFKKFEPLQYNNFAAENPDKMSIDHPKTSNSPAGRHLSLDDCAGLCFERNLWSNPIESNFTYCPLSSECFLWDDEGRKEAIDISSEKHCYIYRKSHSYFFNKKLMTRLSIQVANLSTNETSAEKTIEPTKNEHISQDEKPIEERNEQIQKLNLVRWFAGLSAEECARDCNLRKTACLAFDYCRSSELSLCILYSIRSPANRSSGFYPLTSAEKQFLSLGGTHNLVGHQFCTHYFIKNDYLEIRLQQIEANAAAASTESSVSNSTKQTDLTKRLETIETKELDADQLRTDKEMTLIKHETSTRELIGVNNVDTSSAIHFTWLLVGLVMGTISTMYKREASIVSVRLFQILSNKLIRMSADESVRHLVNENYDSSAMNQL